MRKLTAKMFDALSKAARSEIAAVLRDVHPATVKGLVSRGLIEVSGTPANDIGYWVTAKGAGVLIAAGVDPNGFASYLRLLSAEEAATLAEVARVETFHVSPGEYDADDLRVLRRYGLVGYFPQGDVRVAYPTTEGWVYLSANRQVVWGQDGRALAISPDPMSSEEITLRAASYEGDALERILATRELDRVWGYPVTAGELNADHAEALRLNGTPHVAPNVEIHTPYGPLIVDMPSEAEAASLASWSLMGHAEITPLSFTDSIEHPVSAVRLAGLRGDLREQRYWVAASRLYTDDVIVWDKDANAQVFENGLPWSGDLADALTRVIRLSHVAHAQVDHLTVIPLSMFA